MKIEEPFKFARARRITPQEVERNRQGIEALTGKPRARRGRPPKAAAEKRTAISIRLDPVVLKWAKAQAKAKHVGYQTVINEALAAFARPKR